MTIIDKLLKIIDGSELASKAKKKKAKLYRVRAAWSKPKTQAGAFKSLKNAKKLADQKHLNVYDPNGKCVYKGKKPQPKPTPTPPKPTPAATKQHKAVEFAKKIAEDNSYGYVKFGKAAWKRLCCICHGYKGKKKGFNCIRFVFSCWFHGGSIPVEHEGACIDNATFEKMYKADIKEAKKIAQSKLKCKDLTVIRNKKGIPKSIIEEGDAGAIFKGKKYLHLILLDGKGKMIHAQGSSGNVPKEKQIEYRSAYTPQMIIRYTGK